MLLGETCVVDARSAHSPLISLTAGISRCEAWRAPGAELTSSDDLAEACAAAVRVAFAREAHLHQQGSLAPRMPQHALVGGLLGRPIAAPLDGGWLLPAGKGLPCEAVTLYAFERGAPPTPAPAPAPAHSP